MVKESVDGKNDQLLEPLDKLGFTGTDGVFLAHPSLHHLVKLVAGHRAHPHQEGVGLGQREAACKNNVGEGRLHDHQGELLL